MFICWRKYHFITVKFRASHAYRILTATFFFWASYIKTVGPLIEMFNRIASVRRTFSTMTSQVSITVFFSFPIFIRNLLILMIISLPPSISTQTCPPTALVTPYTVIIQYHSLMLASAIVLTCGLRFYVVYIFFCAGNG